jgi:hypothetical protein
MIVGEDDGSDVKKAMRKDDDNDEEAGCKE